MNKKPLAILLLSIWILQWSTPSIFHVMGIWICHLEHSVSNVPVDRNEKTTQIFFKTSDKIEWEQYGRELKHNDLLYDVVSIVSTSNGTLINCYEDEKEYKIISCYKEVIKQKRNSNSPFSKILKKMIDQKYLSDRSTGDIYFIDTKADISSFLLFPGMSYYHRLVYSPPEFS